MVNQKQSRSTEPISQMQWCLEPTLEMLFPEPVGSACERPPGRPVAMTHAPRGSLHPAVVCFPKAWKYSHGFPGLKKLNKDVIADRSRLFFSFEQCCVLEGFMLPRSLSELAWGLSLSLVCK